MADDPTQGPVPAHLLPAAKKAASALRGLASARAAKDAYNSTWSGEFNSSPSRRRPKP